MYPFVPMAGLSVIVLVAGFDLLTRLMPSAPKKDRLLDVMPLLCIGVTLLLGDHGAAMESLTRIVLVSLAMIYLVLDIAVTMRRRKQAQQA